MWGRKTKQWLFPLPEYLKTNKQESKAKHALQWREPDDFSYYAWGHVWISSCRKVRREFGLPIPWDPVVAGAGPHKATRELATELLLDLIPHVLKPRENCGLLCQIVSEAFSVMTFRHGWVYGGAFLCRCWYFMSQRTPLVPHGLGTLLVQAPVQACDLVSRPNCDLRDHQR